MIDVSHTRPAREARALLEELRSGRGPELPADPSPATTNLSLARSAEGLLSDFDEALRRVAAPGGPDRSPKTLVILPANTLAPLVTAFVSGAIARREVTLKPSRRNQLQVEAWLAWAENRARGVARIEEEARPGDFDLVVAFGSDETMAVLERERAASAEFVGFGSRFSVAVLPPESVREEVVEAAADDVIAWNQNGCLSPQSFFVLDVGAAEDFAKRLASALAERERRFPRGPVDPAVSLETRILRQDVAARARGRVFASSEGTSWTVLFDPRPLLESSPLHRAVWVRSFENAEFLLEAEAQIEAVGIPEGYAVGAGRILPGFEERFLSLGRMQSPGLLRRHGGRESLVEIFAR